MVLNRIAQLSAKQVSAAVLFSAFYTWLFAFQAPLAESSQLSDSPAHKSNALPDALLRKLKIEGLGQMPDGVYIFYDPLCPVCREYFPYLDKLAQEHKKLPFQLVFSSVADKARQEFQKDYKPHASIIDDKNKLLQNLLKAKVTPEAVLVKSGRIIYRGRIDDRYAAIGQRRSLIGSCDLENALLAVEQNRTPEIKETIPIGCFLETTGAGGN